jgi:pimeloyl-ACP methyl ester carboxylesterase
MCGDWPGPTAVAPPSMKAAYRSDALMWLVTAVAGPALLRFVAGVPRAFPLTAAHRANAQRMVEILFPVRERSDGVIFDAYVGNPDVNAYPLERIAVPTLVVHSRDDTMASYASAEAAAERISGARLVSHPRGGHLMLGQQDASRVAVTDFLDSVRRIEAAPPPPPESVPRSTGYHAGAQRVGSA